MSDKKTDTQPIREWPITSFEQAAMVKGVNKIHKNSSSATSNVTANKRALEQDDDIAAKGQLKLKRSRTDDIVKADVSLARWWRHHGRRLISPASLPKSDNPNTILNFVRKTDIAKEFMRTEVKKLTVSLRHVRKPSLSQDERAQIHTALGSFYDKLDKYEDAVQQFVKACCLNPDEKEYKWLLEKAERQLKAWNRQQILLKELEDRPAPDKPGVAPQCQQVQRLSCKELTFQEFHTKFAKTSTPVIITDYLPCMTPSRWTLQHIKDRAGGCKVTVKKMVKESVEWARLEPSVTTTVGEFVDGLLTEGEGTPSEKLYLFDWSLPLNCPALASELTIPRYFAGDFLQRTSSGSLYKDSWPSLFIAPAGLTTPLHVDTFGSNFWMALFQGSKRWVFYPREDQALLYPRYLQSMDPVFEADTEYNDLQQNPLLQFTHPIECVLQPGEVLFVPAGCPHRVENLDTSLAISGNFVDLSNFDLVKGELAVHALIDPRAEELLKQFQSNSFVASMKSEMTDLAWAEYKKWSPDNLNYGGYDCH